MPAFFFRLVVVLLLLAASACQARTPETEGVILHPDTPVGIHVRARILGSGNVEWESWNARITQPGKMVSVKLTGENLLTMVMVTPYLSTDDSLNLVLQQQVWLTGSAPTDVNYVTSYRSLAVREGEPVYLYPLGREPSTGNGRNLEIQILARTYEAKTETD